MEDNRPSKRTKLALDPLQKIRIVEKFNEIINQVDIDAETILLNINRNPDTKQPIEKEINQSRKFIIDRINEIKNICLDNFNKTSYSSEKPFEVIQNDIFAKDCVYLDSDTVRSFTFDKSRLGILLVTDFYICESQAKELK